MTQDSAFTEQQQSGSGNLWGGPGLGGLTGGFGGLTGGFGGLTGGFGGLTGGFGGGWAGPGSDQAQGGHQEVKVGKDESSGGAQAAKDTMKAQGTADPKSPPPYYPSREELMADIAKDPKKFNVPPGMAPDKFAQQYFNEFVAKLVGKQPYAMDAQGNKMPYDSKQAGQVWTPDEKAMLTKWGYNADVPKNNIADDNKNSGLYGLRIDPIKGGDAPPIIAFRGTEPTTGPQDLQSDLGGKYVGQSQYEGNRQLIADRLTRAGDKNVDVVGYSLGGALAQKYAADHVAQVGTLSTFQAPGISKADADKFKAGNADGHVDVNHFYNQNDFVDRAGEAKLDGQFHGVNNPNWGIKDTLSIHPHLSSIICNSNADFEGAVGPGNITTSNKDEGRGRGGFEGARRLLGPAGSAFIGGAYAPIMSGVGDLGNGFSDAKKGGSELLHGAGDLFHNPLKGLGELGHGLWDMGKGAVEGFSGASKIVGGLEAGVGNVALQGLKGAGNLIGKGWDGAKSLAGKGWDATKSLASSGWDATKSLASKGWDGAKSMASTAATGVSNFAHAAGDTVVGAGKAIANTAGNVVNAAGSALSSAGKGISNGFSKGVSAVKNLFHW